MPLLRVFIGIRYSLGFPSCYSGVGLCLQSSVALQNDVCDRGGGSFVLKAQLGCSSDVLAALLLFPMPSLFFLSLSPGWLSSSI